MQFQSIVKISRATFESDVTTYMYGQSKIIQLKCISEQSKCTKQYIKQFTVASYSLRFLAINITLQGAAGYFRIRKYDRNTCFTNQQVDFTVTPSHEETDILFQSENCVTEASINQIQMIILQNNIQIYSKNYLFEDLGLNFATDAQDYTKKLNQIALQCLGDTQCIQLINNLVSQPFPHIYLLLVTQSIQKTQTIKQTMNIDLNLFKHKLLWCPSQL
ncbi:Conserved_hypothetical protein [Hexamita inflata]|uniref:Uncharacterized protein n=1 Tax=Hexamita inflata TaxID=28002 RepID=A0AA86QTP1_9EUKA|nr:Conserved hypothetical protein [Hexamita inflata]